MRCEIRAALVLLVCLLVVGCSGNKSEHQDLREFVEETINRPRGEIEPLPSFNPYESFKYSAVTLRSPFDPPVKEEVRHISGTKTNIKPDLNREKEYLESFNLASLTMVGTLERDGTLWALINDGDGGIHRVTIGNYLGKNHGKITVTNKRQIELVEIVSDGATGWVERPSLLQLVEKE